MRELRFCIGSPSQSQSTSWKVWTQRGDVYLASRSVASDLKVSLHESGECQYSYTSKWAMETGARNRERHLERWKRRRPHPISRTVHLFRVILPGSELRRATADVKPPRGLVWYPPPPSGQSVHVDLWLTPPDSEGQTQAHFMNDLLGALTLDGGRILGVTARYQAVSAADSRSLIRLRKVVAERESRRDPRSHGWALARNYQHVTSLVEFAPFEDEAA